LKQYGVKYYKVRRRLLRPKEDIEPEEPLAANLPLEVPSNPEDPALSRNTIANDFPLIMSSAVFSSFYIPVLAWPPSYLRLQFTLLGKPIHMITNPGASGSNI
jgi:hypothetical protein